MNTIEHQRTTVNHRITPPHQWVAAVAAALAMQIAAIVAAAMATAIVFIAAFATWGSTTSQTPGWMLLAIPVAMGSVALYVGSGHIAARIASDSRGWLMLLVGPITLAVVRSGLQFLIG